MANVYDAFDGRKRGNCYTPRRNPCTRLRLQGDIKCLPKLTEPRTELETTSPTAFSRTHGVKQLLAFLALVKTDRSTLASRNWFSDFTTFPGFQPPLQVSAREAPFELAGDCDWVDTLFH